MSQKESKTKTEDDHHDDSDLEDNEAYGDKTHTGIMRSQVQTSLKF